MTGFMEPTPPDAPGTILSSKTYRTPAMQERGARRLGAAKDEHALRSRLLDMLERRDVDKFFRHVIVNAALEHAHRERKDGNGMYILRDVVKQLRQSKRILPPPPPVSAETIAAIQADQRNGGQQKRASEMAKPQPPAALPALPVIPDSENLDEVFPRPAVEDPADVLARKAARKAEYETERAAGLAVAEEFENMPATTITGLPAYAMDAKQAVYAIPKHIAKELDIELDKVGLYIHQFYGMSLDLFIKANGPKRAYELAQENISRIKAGQNGNGNSPQKAPVSVSVTADSGVAHSEPSAPLVVNSSPMPTIVENQMNEAAFVVLVNLYSPAGTELRFTIRAMTAEELAERLDALVATFSKRGYTQQRATPSAPSAPSGNVQAQSQTSLSPAANAGVATCVMISVASSFEGSKPQLQFECDGYEHPLRYTKANAGLLAQMLAGVRKLDGSPFAASDLEPGRKYPGLWLVDWKEGTSESGKTYRNVMSVRPARPASDAA